MGDYRLLLPALGFWAIRVEIFKIPMLASVILLLGMVTLSRCKINPNLERIFTTLAGFILAITAASIVNTVFPLSEKTYPKPNFTNANNICFPNTSCENENFIQLFLNGTSIIKERFKNLLSSYSSETAGILNGVILGDASLIPDTLSTQIKLSGLQHLVAISGAHISLLIGVAVFLFGRRKPKITAILASLFLFLLVALVGLSASVLRAVLMGLIALGALAFGKGSAATAALSLGIICGATFYPGLAQGAGFQMSVLATGAIIIFGTRISQLPMIKQHFVLQLLIISLVAGSAVIPVSASFQEQLSLLAPFTNLAAAPVVSIMTVLGLIAAVINPLCPFGAMLFLFPSALGAWWISKLADFSASFTFFNVSPWGVAGFQLSLLVGIVFWAKREEKKAARKNIFAHPHHSALSLFPVFTFGAAAVIVFSFLGFSQIVFSENKFAWELIQCDVGQGSALLARKGAQNILIDTGTEKNNALSCLTRNNIKSLNLLVLSHLDADHSGAFERIVRKVHVEKIWLSQNTHPQYRYQQIVHLAKEMKISVEKVGAKNSYNNWVNILSPLLIRGNENDTNNDSLVVELRLETHRVLVLSDVPESVQDQLAQMNLGNFTCVIVAHHGAKSQSRKLAAAIKPDISLISVGNNTYGHPHQNALRIWKAPLLKTTKKCGEIQIGAMHYTTQKEC